MIKYLTTEEADHLVEAILDSNVSNEYKALFLLLRNTGARVGEIIGLNIKNLKSDPFPSVILPNLKRRTPSRKTVPLSLRVLELVRQLRVSIIRGNRQVAGRTMKRYGQKLGLSRDLLHPHVFRHTRAIELVSRGLPLPYVQHFLGHATISSTQVYLDVAPVHIYDMMVEKGLI